MTSLQFFSGIGKKAVIATMIISTLVLAVAAQNVGPQQGRRYGDPGFRGEPINLNVVNADVRDILNYITEQYGINFVIDKSVAKVPVTVNVTDVPWNIALDSIMRSQELGIQVNGTILRVADAKALASEGEVFRAQQNNALDTQPLVTEFIRLNYARAKGGLAKGSSTAGKSSTGDSFALPRANGEGVSPDFTEAGGASGDSEGILPIIRRRLSRRGAIEIDSRSNSLIITDVRENIDAIRQLVIVLDQPEPQVEIEARIVAATRSFSRDIGVQLGAIVTGPRGSGAAGGTLPGNTFQVPPSPGIPNPGVGAGSSLGAQIVNTAIGLTTGVFGTAQINALITMGEQRNQAKTIATPRVTALNNKKAKVESKTQIPITTIQPGGAATGTSIATTTYVDVPLKLEVTPQITDVGTVVLQVLTENASIPDVVPGAAPSISSQTMETQVTVPDGGTTVVGGVLLDDERENTDRTPGLSRIPILKHLFKRKGVSRDTIEILFFITPRIIRPDFGTATGTSGVKSATVLQPVPLGNPSSNSDAPTPVNPLLPAAQPAATPKP